MEQKKRQREWKKREKREAKERRRLERKQQHQDPTEIVESQEPILNTTQAVEEK